MLWLDEEFSVWSSGEWRIQKFNSLLPENAPRKKILDTMFVVIELHMNFTVPYFEQASHILKSHVSMECISNDLREPYCYSLARE